MAPEPKNNASLSSGKIVQIGLDSKSADRMRVLLDNGVEFCIGLLEAASLKVGQMLTGQQVQQFYLDDQGRRARAEALNFLSYRERSQKEVRAHLAKKGYSKSIIAQVLKRLDEENYLDDDRFCALWIQGRQRTRPKGAYALGYELKQKGIDEETIQRHVAQIDEKSAAWAAVEPRLKRWAGLDRRQFISRAGGFLQRRGFGSSVVRQTIDRAWTVLIENASETPDDDAHFFDA